ncbi:hypothetical protein MKW92_022851, partial [Papaver armeniacum]
HLGEKISSRKRRHPSGHGGSSSRYPDIAIPLAIGRPNSLVGQATWFDFKGNVSYVAATYAHFVPVYNFPVAPELKDYYKEIVEEYGHVATTEVLSDRNNLISSVSAVVSVAKEMTEVGDECPSETTLGTWRESFVLPKLLNFNICWIEELFKGLEEKRATRKLVLHGEITILKEEIKAETQRLKDRQKEQIRITAEASKIVADVASTSMKLKSK